MDKECLHAKFTKGRNVRDHAHFKLKYEVWSLNVAFNMHTATWISLFIFVLTFSEAPSAIYIFILLWIMSLCVETVEVVARISLNSIQINICTTSRIFAVPVLVKPR